jgi:hypothetical protein
MPSDDLAFYVSGTHRPRVSAHYRVVDPLAVALKLHPTDGTQTVDWVVARETLAEALVAPHGLGAFEAGPVDPDTTYIRLHPGAGDLERRFLLDRHQLAWFLKRSYALVPLGTENYDQQIDTFIANVLQGA